MPKKQPRYKRPKFSLRVPKNVRLKGSCNLPSEGDRILNGDAYDNSIEPKYYGGEDDKRAKLQLRR